MKWSVALFGHEKPRFYIQDKITGKNLYSFVGDPGPLLNGMKLHHVIGWEKRAEPGDVIDLKPEKCWNCDEQQHRNIVSMLRSRAYLESKKQEIRQKYLNRCRMEMERGSWRPAARFERMWKERFTRLGLNAPQLFPDEISTYFSYLPGASIWHLRGEDVWGSIERSHFLIIGFDGIEPDQLLGTKEPQWDTGSYIEDEEYPSDYIKKRRFKVHLDDLRAGGVDIDKMLDPNITYAPGSEFKHTDCLDKLKSRKVVSADNLRPIQPRKVS